MGGSTTTFPVCFQEDWFGESALISLFLDQPLCCGNGRMPGFLPQASLVILKVVGNVSKVVESSKVSTSELDSSFNTVLGQSRGDQGSGLDTKPFTDSDYRQNSLIMRVPIVGNGTPASSFIAKAQVRMIRKDNTDVASKGSGGSFETPSITPHSNQPKRFHILFWARDPKLLQETVILVKPATALLPYLYMCA